VFAFLMHELLLTGVARPDAFRFLAWDVQGSP